MFYFCGDTHGTIDFDKIRKLNAFIDLTEKDYIVELGDWGLPFLPTDYKGKEEDLIYNERLARVKYQDALRFINALKCTFLVVLGNHDNYDFWNSLPDIEKFGGKVKQHPAANNVFILNRGECYEIDGKTFWAFGGANSIDKMYRTPNYGWWKEEMPSKEEFDHGLDVLKRHDNRVDFILTHDCPGRLFDEFRKMAHFKKDDMNKYFDVIDQTVEYKKWYCGHYHVDCESRDKKINILYDKIKN